MESKRPHWLRVTLGLAVILLVGLTGCDGAGLEAIEPSATAAGLAPTALLDSVTSEAGAAPTVAPTVTMLATEPPPTEPDPTEQAEPTADANSVSYAGVSFVLNPTVASGVSGEIVPEESGEAGGPFWAAVPQHISIMLDGYTLVNTFHEPRVLVYPAEAFAEMNDVAAQTISEQRDFLAAQAEDPDAVPFLPIFNAAQFFATDVEYLDFQNGTGVRFLTQYGQAANPVNSEELFYTFQGLTDDGQYYVALILPVSHPDLPASSMEVPVEEMPETQEELDAYLGEVVTMLEGASEDSFAPSLAELDALVQSLLVQPEFTEE